MSFIMSDIRNDWKATAERGRRIGGAILCFRMAPAFISFNQLQAKELETRISFQAPPFAPSSLTYIQIHLAVLLREHV